MDYRRLIQRIDEAVQLHPELRDTVHHFLFDEGGELRAGLCSQIVYEIPDGARPRPCELIGAHPALLHFADAIGRGVVPELVVPSKSHAAVVAFK